VVNKRIISIFLVLILIMSINFASANFTDVSDDNWASKYIDNVSKNNIVPGFSDATFRPGKTVSKLETLVAIYRTLKFSSRLEDIDEQKLVLKYQSVLEEMNIPPMLSPYGADTYVAVAYALDKKIIVKDELKWFLKDNTLVDAKKIDLAVFMGKAINVYENENLNKIITFDYVDAFDISRVSAPYVYMLNERDIISKKGDENGKFNPNSKISRDIFATMISNMYDYLKDKKDDTKVEENSENKDDSTDINLSDFIVETSGKITNIYSESKLLEIKDMNGKLKVFDLIDAEILDSEGKLSFSSLETNQEVKIFSIKDKANKIIIDKKYKKSEGYLVDFSEIKPVNVSSYYVMTIKNQNGKNEYYKVTKSTYVELNGEISTIDKIEESDKIVVSYEGYMAKKIVAYGKKYEISGILGKVSTFKKGDSVSIKLLDGKSINKILTEDLDVIYASSDREIKKGSIVKVTLKYGELDKIEFTGMLSYDSGIIKEIIISENPKIILLNEDGKFKTYNISKKLVVKDENSKEGIKITSDGIYNLRLNQEIACDLDASGINAITIKKKVEKIKTEGEVLAVYKTAGLLKVKTDEGNYTVSFKTNSGLNVDDYEIGDDVYIYGIKLSNELFEAELIIKLD